MDDGRPATQQDGLSEEEVRVALLLGRGERGQKPSFDQLGELQAYLIELVGPSRPSDDALAPYTHPSTVGRSGPQL